MAREKFPEEGLPHEFESSEDKISGPGTDPDWILQSKQTWIPFCALTSAIWDFQ